VFAAGDGNPPLPGQADHPAIRRHGQAAMGGIGNARALARLYSECLDHPRAAGLIDHKTIGAMTQIHSAGSPISQPRWKAQVELMKPSSPASMAPPSSTTQIVGNLTLRRLLIGHRQTLSRP
jgi:hypothetical protein